MTTKKQALFLDFLELVGKMMRAVKKISGKNIESPGVTMLQLDALDYIKNNPGAPVQDLSGYLFVSPSSVSQLSDRLFSQKLIKRKPDPDDRRSVLIFLTKRGEEVLREMKEEHLNEASEITRFMTTEDIEQMIRIHKNILNHIS